MNIFAVDWNPVQAARWLNNKHVVKMPTETAQILSSAFENGPYRRTHFNHPCSVWARVSEKNFDWLVAHGLALCDEYSVRYGRTIKSKAAIEWCRDHKKSVAFKTVDFTPFAIGFKQYPALVVSDPVQSYRNFYREVKAPISKWMNLSQIPPWWHEPRESYLKKSA